MGVVQTPGTQPGARTPCCNDCGIALCWDISEAEYSEAIAFWDAWCCQDCNGGTPRSLKEWKQEQRDRPLSRDSSIG